MPHILFFEIFQRRKEHSKTFPFFLSQMFMMDFVRASDSSCIPIVCIPEHFKTLVNENIVHKKIGQPVCKNPKANRQAGPKAIIAPTHKTADAHQGIEQKEIIIAFPPTAVFFMVMVFVQTPQKSVHNVFMRKPGHKFHNAEGGDKN
jgi:hypothetical protein